MSEFLSLNVVREKNNFIFSSMGGSINTIKALIHILGDQSANKLHSIDSLDPAALRETLTSVNDLSKTLVIGISKSGTTKETYLLLKAFKERFQAQNLDYRNHFLWITDVPQGKQNIEKAGWKDICFVPIQVDKGVDVGGRFSAPHTVIFLIPLLLLFNKKLNQIKTLWDSYLCLRKDLIFESIRKAYESASKGNQHFAIVLEENLVPALETWVIQLFQESLGSKIVGFNPKTVVGASEAVPEGFEALRLEISSSSIIVQTMLQMYLLQLFVAFFAYYNGINFVTQPEVETYKRKMKKVQYKKMPKAEIVNLPKLIERIRETIKDKPQIRFLEIVCYWHIKEGQRRNIKQILKDAFPDNEIFVFAGTDWNHHSYQAASWNDDTLFIILIKQDYEQQIEGISTQTLNENLTTIKTIAYATYKTLKSKALFIIWNNQLSRIKSLDISLALIN